MRLWTWKVSKKSGKTAEILPADVGVSLIGQSESIVQCVWPRHTVQYFDGCRRHTQRPNIS